MGAVPARELLAPQIRGRVDPWILIALERRGWAVHRIGAAAYAHGEGLHLILGIWRRRDLAPSWVGRLGFASEGYLRRLERLQREQRSRWFLRDGLGRFVVRLPWWRVPGPVVYRHERPLPSLVALEEARARDAHRRYLERSWA